MLFVNHYILFYLHSQLFWKWGCKCNSLKMKPYFPPHSQPWITLCLEPFNERETSFHWGTWLCAGLDSEHQCVLCEERSCGLRYHYQNMLLFSLSSEKRNCIFIFLFIVQLSCDTPCPLPTGHNDHTVQQERSVLIRSRCVLRYYSCVGDVQPHKALVVWLNWILKKRKSI